MKQTTMEEIQAEEVEFLGKKLEHKPYKNNFVGYESMTSELLTATPWDEWVKGAAYATFATWDCSCCTPLDKMDKQELEDRLLYMLKSRPISVAIESAKFMFRLTGISRAITHQLVRHRAMAFGQQSLRVSNPGCDPIRLPQAFFDTKVDEDVMNKTIKTLDKLKPLYFELIAAGVPPEQARAVLPIGITTKICVTMTLRDMMDYFRARTSKIAQGEHDYMVHLMIDTMKEEQPKYYAFIASKLGWEE